VLIGPAEEWIEVFSPDLEAEFQSINPFHAQHPLNAEKVAGNKRHRSADGQVHVDRFFFCDSSGGCTILSRAGKGAIAEHGQQDNGYQYVSKCHLLITSHQSR